MHFVLQCLGWLKRILIGEHAEAILIRSENGLLLVDASDQYVGRHLAREGKYGCMEIERLRACLAVTDDLLVVGAHVGTIVIPISRYCHSVTAIEPNPRSFRLLQMNISINNRDNIRALQVAASDVFEEVEFVVNTINSGGSKRMPVVRDRVYFLDSPKVERVPGACLDDVLRGTKFQVVFMDIEGSEYFALRGMQAILSHAEWLFLEFVPHHLKNVSNVTVKAFVAPIRQHFSHVYVPSTNFMGSTDDCSDVLQCMYERGQSDEGIIFSKSAAFPMHRVDVAG